MLLTVDSVTQGDQRVGDRTTATDVTYTPDPGWNGVDTFTYTVSDGNGGFDTGTVTVTVSSTNIDPLAVDDADSTPEDTAVTIDVLGNDTDADLDPLVVDSVTQGGNGSVTDNDTDVTYTPNQDWNGTDTFTYTISDGSGGFDTATVTVTVSAEPDPPVAVDDADSTLEDSPVTVDVLANDSDPESDSLSVDSVTQGTNGSVVNNGSDVTYTPDPGWNGVDTFSYTVSDGNGGFDTGTVTVTVSSTNIDPLAVDDADSTPEDTAVTIDVLGNDTDADLDPLVVDSVTQGANGSVTDNDTDVTYTPNQDWNGTDTFTYTMSDGQGGTGSATVNVTVTPSNDDPEGKPDVATTSEDTSVTVDVLANDSDVDSSALTITAVSNGANGIVTTDGLIVTYTPDLNWFGTDTFTYRVSDDLGGWCETDVAVTVNPVNDDPKAVDDSATVVQDTPVNIWVLDNDSDPDPDLLSVWAAVNGAHGTVVNHGIKVTYTPAPGWAGIDSFTYTVTDGNDRFDTARVTVTVTGIAPTNQPPVAQDDSVSTDEDIVVTIAALANDSDPDGDTVAVSCRQPGRSRFRDADRYGHHLHTREELVGHRFLQLLDHGRPGRDGRGGCGRDRQTCQRPSRSPGRQQEHSGRHQCGDSGAGQRFGCRRWPTGGGNHHPGEPRGDHHRWKHRQLLTFSGLVRHRLIHVLDHRRPRRVRRRGCDGHRHSRKYDNRPGDRCPGGAQEPTAGHHGDRRPGRGERHPAQVGGHR